MMLADRSLDRVLIHRLDAASAALAARWSPELRFDRHEPFFPLLAGVTLFDADGPSPSFPRQISLAPATPGARAAAQVIEYAIWWDWDIGHLYELEHVWVYLDAAGDLLRCEASAHGSFAELRAPDTPGVARHAGRPVVYAEPGKHAFAASAAAHRPAVPRTTGRATRELVGNAGLLVTPLFRGVLQRTPRRDLLARSYLTPFAFDPAYAFEQHRCLGAAQLVPWAALCDWIPGRIAWWLARLEHELGPEHYEPWRIGHRGAPAYAPDNSLAGIDAAARLGAQLVELDVQCSADGVPLAAHDAVWRVPGRDAAWLPLDRLDAATLARRPEAPATLETLVQRCREQRLGIYLELKDGRAIEPALTVLRRQGWLEHTIGASFRPDWVAEWVAQSAGPGAVLFAGRHVDPVALARGCGAEYVHPCWERLGPRPDALLDDAWMQRVTDAGLGVICWHEERPPVIAALRRRGVAGICSDRPELLRGP
ncbi:MAG: glycerophosphodiester phosphodiesterase [Chloroflexi bacterium]|nr:glycerophosphodiester phosphodiesterase [Chloroflexota bacterium]